MRLAAQADQRPLPEAMDVPEELRRREARLDVIARAKRKSSAGTGTIQPGTGCV